MSSARATEQTSVQSFTNDANDKPTLLTNIKNFFSNLFSFIRCYPILGFLLIGAIIAAIVFTGGAILFPVALSLMVTIGNALGAIIVGLAATTLTSLAFYRYQCIDPRHSHGLDILAGIASCIASLFLIPLSPLAGIIFCGISAVTAVSILFAGMGVLILNCLSSNSPQNDADAKWEVDSSGNSEETNEKKKILRSNSHNDISLLLPPLSLSSAGSSRVIIPFSEQPVQVSPLILSEQQEDSLSPPKIRRSTS